MARTIPRDHGDHRIAPSRPARQRRSRNLDGTPAPASRRAELARNHGTAAWTHHRGRWSGAGSRPAPGSTTRSNSYRSTSSIEVGYVEAPQAIHGLTVTHWVTTSLVCVNMAGLIFTVIGSVAGVAGAFFAWVAVRPRWKSRVKRPAPAGPSSKEGEKDVAGHIYDVFVSYSHDDLDWVVTFAGRLEDAGLRVARDEVFLKPGDVLVHAVEQAIRESAVGILVFSPASVASGWGRQEYAAMMQKSIEDGWRFIPVIIDDVELPAFAATRYYVDFRNVSRHEYDQHVAKIAEALRNEA